MEIAQLTSKVLIIDSNNVLPLIKQFFSENNLTGLLARRDTVVEVLKSNVDLGAIFLAESSEDDLRVVIALARQINNLRPELPIFLRRKMRSNLDDMDENVRRFFCAAYTMEGISKLKECLDAYIFSFVYPNVLVRGIREITGSILLSQIPHSFVSCDTPYIVKDQIVCGEAISLIPLESRWCRGYMMLQARDFDTENPSDADSAMTPSFGNISRNIGEITNLIWGAFKNRYISDDDKRELSQMQVPIVIKLNRKSISFGSNDPQLCFKYTVTDLSDGSAAPVYIYQRFVFNLNWSPEDFKETQVTADELIDTGDLELF